MKKFTGKFPTNSIIVCIPSCHSTGMCLQRQNRSSKYVSTQMISQSYHLDPKLILRLRTRSFQRVQLGGSLIVKFWTQMINISDHTSNRLKISDR